MYQFRKQVVAVIGATGQIGTPLTENLLALGHEVKIFTRKTVESDKSGKLSKFQGLGDAEIVTEKNMMDVNVMTERLKGVEVLVCAVPATIETITVAEPLWLEASVKAGVKRFVPNEFGAHTRGIDWGEGVLFDRKKELHQKIFDSGVGWTFFYNGIIFDYVLPNLRFFRKITTFGDLDFPIYTHEIQDIGRVAAMALTDDRAMNKCFQMDFNVLSQNEMLRQLKSNFPNTEFEYEYFSVEYIKNARDTATDVVSAKKGAETDKERWGINYCLYVKGKLASFTDDTMRGTDLYPEYKVLASPDKAIADPAFVFDKVETIAD